GIYSLGVWRVLNHVSWCCSIPFATFLFFFSSRRRHTRLVSDWSSDVCSSDLRDRNAVLETLKQAEEAVAPIEGESERPTWLARQIGRASCRERAEVWVGDAGFKKKTLHKAKAQQNLQIVRE